MLKLKEQKMLIMVKVMDLLSGKDGIGMLLEMVHLDVIRCSCYLKDIININGSKMSVMLPALYQFTNNLPS